MSSQRDIFSENLSKLLSNRNIDQKILAEIIGVSETSVSNWMLGKKYPRIDKIQMIADYFRISKSDLIEQKPTNLKILSPETLRIPVLGKIACGDPILAEENIERYIYRSVDGLPSGELMALEVQGDSMEPTIPNKATVIVRLQADVENGEIAAVLVNGNSEATLKRVKKQGNTIILMPDNSKHEPYVISKDNPATIIGKAISFEIAL